jgi:hypothetical protein
MHTQLNSKRIVKAQSFYTCEGHVSSRHRTDPYSVKLETTTKWTNGKSTLRNKFEASRFQTAGKAVAVGSVFATNNTTGAGVGSGLVAGIFFFS